MKKFKDKISNKTYIPFFSVINLTTEKPMMFMREFIDDVYGESAVIEVERFENEFEEVLDESS
jgi:hypothetical protein